MNLTIRKATIADLPAIQKMNHQLFLSDAAYAPELNAEWPYLEDGKKYFEERIAQKKGVCFIAVVDSTPVGYLAGDLRGPASAWSVRRTEVENMSVDEAYRSNGIGSRLMRAFFEWSKHQGARKVIVGAFAGNDRAIAFYQSNGFGPHEIVQEATLEP